jgi:hypothetical protein
MIHAILIGFNNPEQTRLRIERDMQTALELAAQKFGLGIALTIIDNSAERSDDLNARFGLDYHWMKGHNLQYGPSINVAVRRLPSVFTIYCCTRHGRSFDPTWAIDLLQPMVDNPVVGLSGCLWGSNSPEGVAYDCKQDWIKEKFRFVDAGGTGYVPQHVQGGVFAARTEVLLRFPYSDDIPHLYTDHLITWNALQAGYKCQDVPSVRSIWRDVWAKKYKMDGIKYLHDEANT